jgi:tRNA threonylcarbamoyladenosine biosynthesis protein TsaB
MKTLAIDTSLAAGSAAAIDGGRVADRRFAPPGDHARLLAAALADVAGELGWTPRDAELIAVIRGPGSFTGLRVGVAAAKAVAWATGARLVGVSAFDVIARTSSRLAGWPDAPIQIGFDAGRGEVFAATAIPAAASPTGWSIGPAALAALADWIDSLAPDALVSGPVLAVEACAAAIAARPGLRLAPPAARTATAVEAGRVALLRAAAGEYDDLHTLLPDYIRPSYAEDRG